MNHLSPLLVYNQGNLFLHWLLFSSDIQWLSLAQCTRRSHTRATNASGRRAATIRTEGLLHGMAKGFNLLTLLHCCLTDDHNSCVEVTRRMDRRLQCVNSNGTRVSDQLSTTMYNQTLPHVHGDEVMAETWEYH